MVCKAKKRLGKNYVKLSKNPNPKEGPGLRFAKGERAARKSAWECRFEPNRLFSKSLGKQKSHRQGAEMAWWRIKKRNPSTGARGVPPSPITHPAALVAETIIDRPGGVSLKPRPGDTAAGLNCLYFCQGLRAIARGCYALDRCASWRRNYRFHLIYGPYGP